MDEEVYVDARDHRQHFIFVYWGATASKKTFEEQVKTNGAKPKDATSQTQTTNTAPPQTTTTQPKGVNLTLDRRRRRGKLARRIRGRSIHVRRHADQGASKELKAEKEIRLNIGNAGGLSIKQNGKDIGSLGQAGEVVERTFSVEGK